MHNQHVYALNTIYSNYHMGQSQFTFSCCPVFCLLCLTFLHDYFWALFCHLAVLNSVPLDQKSHGFVLHFVLDSLAAIGLYDNNLLRFLFELLKS